MVRTLNKRDTSLEDKRRSRRPSILENDALCAALKPSSNTRDLKAAIGVAKSTIHRTIQAMNELCTKEALTSATRAH